eukprot:UN11001
MTAIENSDFSDLKFDDSDIQKFRSVYPGPLGPTEPKRQPSTEKDKVVVGRKSPVKSSHISVPINPVATSSNEGVVNEGPYTFSCCTISADVCDPFKHKHDQSCLSTYEEPYSIQLNRKWEEHKRTGNH